MKCQAVVSTWSSGFQEHSTMIKMFLSVIISILGVVGALDTTRVSRIKPTFLNHQPKGISRYQSASGGTTHYDQEETTQYPSSEAAVMVVTEAPAACDRPYSCRDCTTYRLCVPGLRGFTELLSGHCPEDRPYCDDYSGTCVNDVSAAVRCGSPDHSFHCMRDGHFPHPTDATKYFICSDLKAYGYSCRDGYKYYAPSLGCSQFSWIANPFECSDLNATKVLYTNGGSYFAYCVNGQPFVVSSCSEYEVFNTTTQVCEPQCSNREFIIADRNNCMKYFKCSKNSESHLYVKESLWCPNGEGFQSNLKKCVTLNKLPNCKPQKKEKKIIEPFRV